MRQRGLLFLTTILMVALLITQLNSCSTSNSTGKGLGPKSKSLLDKVKDRGKLNCGVNGNLPGFSFENENGEYSGLDVDICRAVAAALFDDPEKINYRNLVTSDRCIAVSNGDVDLLSSNTTWTLKRDTNCGIFTQTIFYDGQGMMVRKDSDILSLKDLQNRKVCVLTGTTSELNLNDKMRELGVKYIPVSFVEINDVYNAYNQGKCEGITSDKSQLISRRSILFNPGDHVLRDKMWSKEPLAPSVVSGEPELFHAVKWIIYALIEAEELGINQDNLEQMKESKNPTIMRFLGIEGDLGRSLGLSKDFTQRIIKHVGNYGEIYERNLGAKSDFNLPRGVNDLWTRGGLLYSPPFR